MEEQGYNPLHLALFFLRWSENPASKVTCLAPLVLVPVGLDRVRPDRYQAVWTKEEVQFNVALQVRLKEKQGIELPEVENTSNLRILKEYLKRVDEIFSQKRGLADRTSHLFGLLQFYQNSDVERSGLEVLAKGSLSP